MSLFDVKQGLNLYSYLNFIDTHIYISLIDSKKFTWNIVWPFSEKWQRMLTSSFSILIHLQNINKVLHHVIFNV